MIFSVIQKHPFLMTSITLFMPLSLTLTLAAFREPIRRASVELVKQMIAICDRIDAKVLVVHPGHFTYSFDIPAARAALNISIGELADISRDNRVKICVENMPKDWDCFLFQYLDIDLDGIGFALDVGHANTTNTLEEFIKYDISHFHLHDNKGDKDEHLWIGGGNIDFMSLRDMLNKSRAIKVLEHRCDKYVDKSMVALKEMGII